MRRQAARSRDPLQKTGPFLDIVARAHDRSSCPAGAGTGNPAANATLGVPLSFPSLTIGDLSIARAIIQGGMGVGISLSGLASAVAAAGGFGVISPPPTA